MAYNIYLNAYDLLKSNKKIVLARTIRRSGSAPRDVGSMCIITEDKTLIGTVGGGILEYKVMQKAMELFDTKTSCIYRFRLDNKNLASCGMICGGDVDLFLEPLFPENTEMVSIYKDISRHILNRLSCRLITTIKDNIAYDDISVRCFIDSHGNAKGNINEISHKNLETDDNVPWHLTETCGVTLFIENIRLASRLFLFGAGHVSVFVSKLAGMVGFNISLIDDRPEFANKGRFPHADEILIQDFKSAFDSLNISSSDFIVIMTRGHLHDKIVLELSLKTHAAYIGMIGSRRKRNTIYTQLVKEGVEKARLEKVHAPIGLDINAETPEEIAVSIVGELIQIRAPEKKSNRLIL